MSIQVQRFDSREALLAALVARLEAVVAASRAGSLAVMLSGGSTPLPAYREVARRNPAPAPKLRVLYSDDRYVPPSSDSSNYHQTEPLLSALSLPPEGILRVRTELPLAQAAAEYERQLTGLLASGVRIPLGLLGLGADGHTASLFRLEHLTEARGKLAIAVQRPDGMAGVSATPELFAQVQELLFVVAGGGKKAALEGLLRQDPQVVAARAVQGHPRVGLWLDPESAAGLPF